MKEELIRKEKVEVQAQDAWRVSYLASLLQKRQVADYLALDDEEAELPDLIDSLCVNRSKFNLPCPPVLCYVVGTIKTQLIIFHREDLFHT